MGSGSSSEGSDAKLALCSLRMSYFRTFVWLGVLGLATQLSGLLYLLITKNTRDDQDFKEAIAECIETGFWFLAFLAVGVADGFTSPIPQYLILASLLASIGRGIFAWVSMTRGV